jgi:hypothetical protein
MSLNRGTYFQRGITLQRSDWVDHSGHGDRHERNASLLAEAAAGFSGRNASAENGFQAIKRAGINMQ